ncbi:Rrf2 family transcriptional regulator [Pediococcus stilesii]|uniref:BadM Rrf2 family transcriptional regulator n=1 Tax=Pediococcus stilesii TaxID=331679 RepID=A0A0R2L2Z2_9LACO|nr:Rrf2 family transcriptional regulator [Pediococcus stilesii]KRN94182.1 BadM Rrf2 family transcriptional regulator [Pediococcus stilesii]
MKYSYKLSDAIHILAFLDIYKNGDLSSKMIASSIETNASTVRSLMSDLKKAGLISTRQGSVNPALTRSADQITLLDVYQAINMDHNLLHVDPKTNPQCVVGGNIQETLNAVYADIQESAFQKMALTSIQDIIDDVLERNQVR